MMHQTPRKRADTACHRWRLATFNAALFRTAPGELARDLAPGNPDAQALACARIIARVDPDVLLINEFDHDRAGLALRRFEALILNCSSRPTPYPHRFTTPCNTGEPTGLDLNRDGCAGGPEDAFGFGAFPGQYGMALLSRLPLDRHDVRTFRHYPWARLPGMRWPMNPEDGTPWYDAAARRRLRLSSKNHWDVPLRTGAGRVHLLASHPTPPAFDGAEMRNHHRNRDELRFWLHYLDATPGLADDQGRTGGAGPAPVVLMGDLNADTHAGNGDRATLAALLEHPRLQDPRPRRYRPEHPGAGWPSCGHTAAFGRLRMRLDYILPDARLRVCDAGVFWPRAGEPGGDWVGNGERIVSSDHRLVWVDVETCRPSLTPG